MFPDGEKILVTSIREALLDAGETGIRVATRKATPEEEAENPVPRQVTVRSDGGIIVERLSKEEDFGLNIFVKNEDRNEAYAEANRLASLIEALIPVIPGLASSQLRSASVNSIIPIEIDTEEQQRYARISVILQGSTLNL
jgi:hypothetical protein